MGRAKPKGPSPRVSKGDHSTSPRFSKGEIVKAVVVVFLSILPIIWEYIKSRRNRGVVAEVSEAVSEPDARA